MCPKFLAVIMENTLATWQKGAKFGSRKFNVLRFLKMEDSLLCGKEAVGRLAAEMSYRLIRVIDINSSFAKRGVKNFRGCCCAWIFLFLQTILFARMDS